MTKEQYQKCFRIINQYEVDLNDFECRRHLDVFFADEMDGSNQYPGVYGNFGMLFKLTHGQSAGGQHFSINNQILVGNLKTTYLGVHLFLPCNLKITKNLMRNTKEANHR